MTPDFARVVVELEKLRDYCLSDQHPRGRHKARVFRASLGITAADAPSLRDTLIEAVRQHSNEFRPGEADEYGQRYVLDFQMTMAVGASTIRSAWIVRTSEDVLRLTTCYVLESKD